MKNLRQVGLLPMGNEEHLPFAWKHYKDGSPAGQDQAEEFKLTFSRDVTISFVGVWFVRERKDSSLTVADTWIGIPLGALAFSAVI